MYTLETDKLTAIINRFMSVDDVTTGSSDHKFLVRYRGRLLGEAETLYDKIKREFHSLNITPLFRLEEERHVILLMDGTVKSKKANPLINIGLFIATTLSVLFAGALYAYTGPAPESQTAFIETIIRSLPTGVPFAVSLLAILLAHEFGHYIAARINNTNVSLPYFLPFPLSPFGTMGAFIQLKEPPKNKRVLLDIGISGPIAGFVVAVPILLYGLSLSSVERVVIESGKIFQLEGNSIIYLLSKFIVFGELLPAPLSYGGTPPFLYWIRYFFTSQPLPMGGIDVFISPVAWAGWAGLLVTALNLIPAGQLDGGHIIYSIFGKRSRLILPFVLGALILLGFVWSGWWLWAFLLLVLGGLGHPEPLDQITTLDSRRKAVALIGLVIFVLVFTPVPLLQAVAGG